MWLQDASDSHIGSPLSGRTIAALGGTLTTLHNFCCYTAIAFAKFQTRESSAIMRAQAFQATVETAGRPPRPE